MDWVKKLQKDLYDLGFFDSNLSEELAVDGLDGKNTRNALKRARSLGYFVNNLKKLQHKSVKIETEDENEESDLYFEPSITNGVCDTQECAKFVNNELEHFYGVRPYGHAWTNFQNVLNNKIISGYSDLSNKYLARSNQRNFSAAENFREKVDTAQMDIHSPYLANMYYPFSPNFKKAYDEGLTIKNAGRITGTHTGIVWFDPKKQQWQVTDNVHKKVSTRPLKTVLYSYKGNKNRLGITAIGQYKQSSNSLDTKQFFDSNLNVPSFDGILTPRKKWINFDKSDGQNHYVTEDLLLEFIKNGASEEFMNGIDMSDIGFVRTGNLNTYANINSPAIATSTYLAKRFVPEISDFYNIPTGTVESMIPLILGIAWKESNGGSNYYVSNGKLRENKSYSTQHLNTFHDKLRKFVNKVTMRDPSLSLTSTKLNMPLTYNESDLLDSKGVSSKDVYVGGINALSKMSQHLINLTQLLGDKANILYNEDGTTLSLIGQALLLEAHNQGTDKGIKKSIEAYLKTNDLNYLRLFYNPAFRPNKNNESATYAPVIMDVIHSGFEPYKNKYILNEITVTPESK